MREDVTQDALLGGRVRLLQPARGHRAGTDAVLLAAFAGARPGETVVDAGASTGAVGLMIAALVPGTRLVLVERDKSLAALAGENARANGLGDRARVAAADLLEPGSRRAAGLEPGSADLVATNPPYLDPASSQRSPDPGRAAAHVLEGGLRAWIRACAALLRDGGRLALVHRADRLPEILDALGAGLGGVALRFVHPREGEPAHRLLLSAVKGSRAPLGVAPPLVLHDRAGAFTREAAALHRGAWPGGDQGPAAPSGAAGTPAP
jgi:tRNA1(Val) A37 N6-methylase TrmN6